MSAQPIEEDQEKDITEYKDWFETISVASYGEADATTWCKAYLNIPSYRLDDPHFKAEKMKFKAPIDSQILEYTPEPDYTDTVVDHKQAWMQC
jgi:hypothetical protein